MPTSGVSNSELNRRLERLENDLKEDIHNLVTSQNQFIKDLSDLAKEFSGAANTMSVVTERLNSSERRLYTLESFNTWLVRTVLGALLIGAVGLLFVLNQGPR